MNYNRILLDSDRTLYKYTIADMYKYIPMTGNKIGDAIVQQAFVYNAAIDLLLHEKNVRILSAGSFQDTAAELLRLEGYAVYDVDPVLNYTLHTFVGLSDFTGLYDVVISTSVLEHTVDDQEFIADCCQLLKFDGYGIFTMDFKDDYKPGDNVPYTSNRFYTAFDLCNRLRAVLQAHNCDLIDTPDYTAKDRFIWDGINYSFATWVFQKKG